MPYRIDFFAIFIFLGIVQAIFLCFFFFKKENRTTQSNVFHGVLLLSMALCTLEILVMYTGHIADVLFLVDFSEPVAFVIGPAFYLMVLSLIRGKIDSLYFWHFAVPVVYLLLALPFYFAPDEVKYNAWVNAYQPGLPFIEHDYREDPILFFVTDHHTVLVMFSLSVYAVLTGYEVIRVFRRKGESIFKPVNPVLKKLQTGFTQLMVATFLLFVIKSFYESDTGDHWFAAYVSILIYLTSFRVINQSGFFKPAAIDEATRSRASVVTPEVSDAVVSRLVELMEKEKPFLNSGFSLPELAQKTGTSVHILSQVINERMNKGFHEMTASYRVEEAKKLLIDQRHIKIEEIAERVGYQSKSSFNNAFKKITGQTPSEFRG